MLSQEQTDRVSFNGQCDTYAWLSQRAWVEIDYQHCRTMSSSF
jgi:alanine racemase